MKALIRASALIRALIVYRPVQWQVTVFINPITWGAYRAYTRQITTHNFENVKTCEQKFTARIEHLEYFVKFVLKLKQFIKCCAYLGIYASINYLAEIYEQLTIEQ